MLRPRRSCSATARAMSASRKRALALLHRAQYQLPELILLLAERRRQAVDTDRAAVEALEAATHKG